MPTPPPVDCGIGCGGIDLSWLVALIRFVAFLAAGMA